MALKNKVYFASDFHLGIDGKHTSKKREILLGKWLQKISGQAQKIYLLGDLFDFWFEYKKVIPKGFTYFLGTLAMLKEQGTEIEVFTGNHDHWMFGYFEQELDILVHHQPILREIQGKRVYMGHGDGLGNGDSGYKFLKNIFLNPFCQGAFSMIHPNISLRLAQYFSNKSRANNTEAKSFLGAENEWLIQFCEEHLKSEAVDYYIFGHRHLPIKHLLSNQKSHYYNTGDWITHYTYLQMQDGGVELRKLV